MRKRITPTIFSNIKRNKQKKRFYEYLSVCLKPTLYKSGWERERECKRERESEMTCVLDCVTAAQCLIWCLLSLSGWSSFQFSLGREETRVLRVSCLWTWQRLAVCYWCAVDTFLWEPSRCAFCIFLPLRETSWSWKKKDSWQHHISPNNNYIKKKCWQESPN